MKCKSVMDAMNQMENLMQASCCWTCAQLPYIESISLPIPMIKAFRGYACLYHKDETPLVNGADVGQFNGYKIVANNTEDEFWINFSMDKVK